MPSYVMAMLEPWKGAYKIVLKVLAKTMTEVSHYIFLVSAFVQGTLDNDLLMQLKIIVMRRIVHVIKFNLKIAY